ncbi:unnamed protein product [Onchocerca flexuosa]|uniref:Nephrin n=1 Tax=Onchocerca flexuosa TaxID=387005 RepID=A0A183I1T0_9BILA|nr:unnamed protein product [Onchocerca flexuosa]
MDCPRMKCMEPEKPIITRQPSGAVQEGELVTIECQTKGGNPPPSFLWVFNNRSVVPEDWYHVRSSISPDRPSVSILQWRINAEDNEAYLNCQIWNEAMPKDEHKDASTTRLNASAVIFKVLYGPRVHVGPVYDYNVEEGERVELTCSANTVNTLTVRSKKSKSIKRMGQAFTVIDVYFFHFAIKNINNVLRRPGEALIRASSDVIAVGGETTLSCIAVDVGSPEAEYRWLTPSSSGKYKERKTPIYTLEHATLADNGDYRCMPFNRIGDGVEGILTIKVSKILH